MHELLDNGYYQRLANPDPSIYSELTAFELTAEGKEHLTIEPVHREKVQILERFRNETEVSTHGEIKPVDLDKLK